MIKLAIIEDVAEDRTQLSELVSRYAETSGTQIKLKEFEGSLDFLKTNEKFDIILLDIMMPDCNGMEMAHRLREFDEDTVIIFVTGMEQYAIEGYSVSAIGFLIKPTSYEHLSNALDRAINSRGRRLSNSILIKTHTHHVIVDVSSIEYVEIKGHFLVLHTQNGDIQTKGTLKDMLDKLGNSSFIHCNNRTIVNVNHIRSIKDNTVFLPSGELAISRRRRPEFIETVLRCSGGLSNA